MPNLTVTAIAHNPLAAPGTVWLTLSDGERTWDHGFHESEVVWMVQREKDALLVAMQRGWVATLEPELAIDVAVALGLRTVAA